MSTDPKRQEVSLDEEDEFEEFQVEGEIYNWKLGFLLS
jgi:hypothetical protein